MTALTLTSSPINPDGSVRIGGGRSGATVSNFAIADSAIRSPRGFGVARNGPGIGQTARGPGGTPDSVARLPLRYGCIDTLCRGSAMALAVLTRMTCVAVAVLELELW
jgi:hypothetical protein